MCCPEVDRSRTLLDREGGIGAGWAVPVPVCRVPRSCRLARKVDGCPCVADRHGRFAFRRGYSTRPPQSGTCRRGAVHQAGTWSAAGILETGTRKRCEDLDNGFLAGGRIAACSGRRESAPAEQADRGGDRSGGQGAVGLVFCGKAPESRAVWLARLRLRVGQVWGLRILYRLPGSENASFRSLWIFLLAAEEAGAPLPRRRMTPDTDKRPAATNHSIGGGLFPEKFFRKNREFTWGGEVIQSGTPPAGICPPAPRSIETTPPLARFFFAFGSPGGAGRGFQ